MAALNLPFLLVGPESAPLLAEVEAALRCSVLELLTGGLTAYVDDAELLSSSMIAVRHAATLATLQPCVPRRPQHALQLTLQLTVQLTVQRTLQLTARLQVRQLLGCWLEGDDTVDFVGLDQPRWEAVRASGLLNAVAAMVAGHAPSLEDEGSLELHEHAIACWSAACGLQPDGARAAALCEAGAVLPTLRALEAVTPVFVIARADRLGEEEEVARLRRRLPSGCATVEPEAAAEEEEEVAAAAELVRAACALLQALARTEAGRAALRCAGGAATLDALLAATGDPSGESEMHEAIGALRRRLAERQHGQTRRPGSGRQSWPTCGSRRPGACSIMAAPWAPEPSCGRLGPAAQP